MDYIEEALVTGFNDPELQEQCDQLTLKMWRNVIYPQIDYIRRLLTTNSSTSSTKDENDRPYLAQQLDTAILGHLGRIGHIVAVFTGGKREKFESDAFLMGEFGTRQSKLLVRLLTFSGDLSTGFNEYLVCLHIYFNYSF